MRSNPIFKRDLPDANIDFKKEWDNAFADVNQEREQYQAAFKQQGEIAQLEQKQQSRLQIRGKLLYFKPIINQQLSELSSKAKHYSNNSSILSKN